MPVPRRTGVWFATSRPGKQFHAVRFGGRSDKTGREVPLVVGRLRYRTRSDGEPSGSVFGRISTESLILAQDERWRRA